jgi:hypothetical protein
MKAMSLFVLAVGAQDATAQASTCTQVTNLMGKGCDCDDSGANLVILCTLKLASYELCAVSYKFLPCEDPMELGLDVSVGGTSVYAADVPGTGKVPVPAVSWKKAGLFLDVTLGGTVSALTLDFAASLCKDDECDKDLFGVLNPGLPLKLFNTNDSPLDLGVCPDTGLSAAAAGGVVVGVLSGLGAAAAAFFCWKKRRQGISLTGGLSKPLIDETGLEMEGGSTTTYTAVSGE